MDRHVIAVAPLFHNYGYRKGQWFYAFNLLCEIDSPGVWHLDREASVLFFWHYARWQRMYTPAVGVAAGVGNRVTNNLMYDAPHQASGFSGNDHIIELNEIHSVCHESNDAGAIYGGCNWSYRSTYIRNNYPHFTLMPANMA